LLLYYNSCMILLLTILSQVIRDENMQRIWLTSDNHFSHKRISEMCPRTRPDRDWQVMDQKMIQQWQAQVQRGDIVYMLGDEFWCSATSAIEIMKQLPGQKHLIYGNHDKVIRSNATLRGMFASVSDYKEIKLNGQKIILFHFPIWEWHKIQSGAIHFHGHIHDEISGVPGRIVNVCVDSPEMADTAVPYALYPIEDAIKLGQTKIIRGHHNRADGEEM
jgi:calcineurin-like phosphoesterase family protein